jgi:hypothetical protein
VEGLALVAEDALLILNSTPQAGLDAGSAPLLAEGVPGDGLPVTVGHVGRKPDARGRLILAGLPPAFDQLLKLRIQAERPWLAVLRRPESDFLFPDCFPPEMEQLAPPPPGGEPATNVLPATVYLLLDVSGSMDKSKLQQAQDGGASFAEDAIRKGYRVGVITFTSWPRLRTEPTAKIVYVVVTPTPAPPKEDAVLAAALREYSATPAPATPDARAAGEEFIGALERLGGQSRTLATSLRTDKSLRYGVPDETLMGFANELDLSARAADDAVECVKRGDVRGSQLGFERSKAIFERVSRELTNELERGKERVSGRSR